jgi:hypothetical protein
MNDEDHIDNCDDEDITIKNKPTFSDSLEDDE